MESKGEEDKEIVELEGTSIISEIRERSDKWYFNENHDVDDDMYCTTDEDEAGKTPSSHPEPQYLVKTPVFDEISELYISGEDEKEPDDINKRSNVFVENLKETSLPCGEEEEDSIQFQYDAVAELIKPMIRKFDASLHSFIRSCVLFWYLFPKDYEFYMDDIIQLWIAQGYIDIPLTEVKRSGIIGKKVPKTKEDIGRLWFEEFYGLGVIKLSHLDSSTGRLRYKLNPTFVDQLQGQSNKNHYYFSLDDDNAYISDNTLHASLRDSVDLITLNDLYQAKKLYTLLILHKQGSYLDQIPRDLFLKLHSLRALDFSHTCITELPSSIGNLGDLKYLNLSGTPITTLPASLCSLYQIQTLKLRGCLKLLHLPKGMNKLVNLRHLDVDVSCLMNSMPPGFGNLVELQTLPAFIISEENGCHITELKNLVNLHGTFRILKLENVSNSKEAKEVALYQKEHLDKLEFHWTELQDGLKLLEYLQPHTQVKELQIVGYGGPKFPSWIGNDSFSILTSITIHDCRNCEVLPPLGKLPSLKTLCLSNMIAVKTIDSQFCGRDSLTGVRDFVRFRGKRSASNTSVAFLTLETLTLKSLLSLEKWSGMKELDFPSLKKLKILDCPKLTALRKISLLNDLKTLEISFCPSLTLPNEGLPTSLQHLVITDCAVLKDRCHKDIGKDWLKIAHIPDIWIDYQHISQSLKGITVPRLSTSYVDNNKDASNDPMFKPRGDPTENPNDDQEKNNRDTTAPSKPTSFLSNLILNPFKSFTLKATGTSKYISNKSAFSVDTIPSTQAESVPSAEVNSGNEKIPGSPLRVPGSPRRMPGTPFRVPPSPSQFPMAPQINRIGSVHLNMNQVFKATQNFSPSLIIGEGGFGTVYKAQLQDGQVVAIKRAKKEHINILNAEFSSEVELLAKIEHRNLVRLLGYVEKGNERIIITENVPNGTLREHLDGQHEKILDFNQRLEIAIDVAHALTYLHLYAEKQIIHRDVKSSNILLTENMRAKVADFGFARVGPTEDGETHILTKVKGTAGYLDPEYLRTYQLTTKSDVYSFGILIIEIITGRRPVDPRKPVDERVTVRWAFKNYNEGNVVGLLDPLMNEVVDARILSKMFSLAFQCAAPTRQDRPDMKEVGELLWKIRMSYRKSVRRE